MLQVVATESVIIGDWWCESKASWLKPSAMICCCLGMLPQCLHCRVEPYNIFLVLNNHQRSKKNVPLWFCWGSIISVATWSLPVAWNDFLLCVVVWHSTNFAEGFVHSGQQPDHLKHIQHSTLATDIPPACKCCILLAVKVEKQQEAQHVASVST